MTKIATMEMINDSIFNEDCLFWMSQQKQKLSVKIVSRSARQQNKKVNKCGTKEGTKFEVGECEEGEEVGCSTKIEKRGLSVD